MVCPLGDRIVEGEEIETPRIPLRLLLETNRTIHPWIGVSLPMTLAP